MYYRFPVALLIGSLILLPACGNEKKPSPTGVEAVAPGPVSNGIWNLVLVPNADLSPQQWTAQWVPAESPETYNFQAINDGVVQDDDNIYNAGVVATSRFGFSGINSNSNASAIAIELHTHMDYVSIHGPYTPPGGPSYDGDAVDLTVRLYSGGNQIASATYTYCADYLSGCDVIQNPPGERSWTTEFTGLDLDAAAINSLEAEVETHIWYEHPGWNTHYVHMKNLYCYVTFEGPGGKEPQPTE